MNNQSNMLRRRPAPHSLRGPDAGDGNHTEPSTPTVVEEEQRAACQRSLLARRAPSDERGCQSRTCYLPHPFNPPVAITLGQYRAP
jgi:hypothetical protein